MSTTSRPRFLRTLTRQAALIALGACALVIPVHAAPLAINLGNLTPNVQSDYSNASTSFEVTLARTEVQWFSFNITAARQIIPETDYYLDINTYPNTDRHVDTTIGLYDSGGTIVGLDADGGDVFYSQLSFGDIGTDRGPLTYYTENGQDFKSNIARGQNGYLPEGTYYLAVTRFHATFGANFAVTSDSAEPTTDTFLLQFRGQSTAVIPEPSTVALLGLGVGLVLYRISRQRTLRA